MNVDQPHIERRIIASEDMVERRLTDFVCSCMQPQFRPLFLALSKHVLCICVPRACFEILACKHRSNIMPTQHRTRDVGCGGAVVSPN
jgi:hypothetical protein